MVPTPDRNAALERLAAATKWMVRILLPALIILVGLAAISFGGGVLAFSLMSHWLRWVLLALTLALLVVAVLLVVRYLQMWRATANPSVVAAEFVELAEIGDIASHVLTHGFDLVSKEGGIRAWARARALWQLLQTMVIVEAHVEARTHARYILPPKLPESWGLVLTTFWLSLGVLGAAVIIPGIAAIIS